MKHAFSHASKGHQVKVMKSLKTSELNLLLTNINNNQPACSILMGDFNAKYSKWCSSDKNNIAGLEIDNITTTAGYSKLINKPTHFVNGISFFIDLIFFPT